MGPHIAAAEAALRGDRAGLRRVCTGPLGDGLGVADLVVEVLAPAQREIGRRWLSGEASVADEHRATATVDSVLAAVELELPPPTRRAPVVCVCAEGEWHAIAARMLAMVVADGGWPVIFLGPSLPAADLARVARENDAAAVAISTGTVAALPGTARCVRAVAQVGRPVVVGGHAFSAVPAAAEALGAPFFDDPRMAVAAIGDLPLTRGRSDLGGQEVLAVDGSEPHLVRLAAETLRSRLSAPPDLRPVLHEAVGYGVGFARSALLLHDRSVITSHHGWLETFVSNRGLQVTGAEILAAVDEAGSRVLEDPCLLHDVIAG